MYFFFTNSYDCLTSSCISVSSARAEYQDHCLHILCLDGAARFTVGDTIFNMVAGDAIIKSSPKPISDVHRSDDFRISALLISFRFLQGNTPESSYNIIGHLSTMQNPVMPMNEADMERCQLNFQEIRRRLEQPYHNFFAEVLRRAVEQMILDFYDIHARHTSQNIEGVSQASRILGRFVALLQEGLYKKERSVDYYASRLFITPKYLSECCVSVSGHNASYWIEHFTTQDIVRQLNERSKPLSQIANDLHFSSLSYLSRYVRRTLGCSPREYRDRLK